MCIWASSQLCIGQDVQYKYMYMYMYGFLECSAYIL